MKHKRKEDKIKYRPKRACHPWRPQVRSQDQRKTTRPRIAIAAYESVAEGRLELVAVIGSVVVCTYTASTGPAICEPGNVRIETGAVGQESCERPHMNQSGR